MALIRFDMRDMQQLADAWERAPAVVLQELEAAMYLSTGMLHSEIVDNTPVGASGGSGAGLAGSISYNVASTIGSVTGTVGTPNPYAVAVEMGTKPHFPPVDPIREWVEAKLGIGADKSEEVAFLIARKISRVGTRPAKMFQRGLVRLSGDIERTFSAALGRIVNRLEGMA